MNENAEFSQAKKFAMLVHNELNQLRHDDQYDKTPEFPGNVHHRTREMNRWEGGPITKRDVLAFKIGVRASLDVLLRVMNEFKYDHMTDREIRDLLYSLENAHK